MEQMTDAERKYWEQKRRLLLSEAAEIERMLDADRQASPAVLVVDISTSNASASGLSGVGVVGAGIGR